MGDLKTIRHPAGRRFLMVQGLPVVIGGLQMSGDSVYNIQDFRLEASHIQCDVVKKTFQPPFKTG